MCGVLGKSMYGTGGAAQSWESDYTRIYIEDLGFVQGKASPCVFYHRDRDLRVVVHGDDFTALGADEDCEWLAGQLRQYFELKVSAKLGPEDTDDKQVRILNRTVEWTNQGIRYEPDARHAEIVVKQL